MARLSSAPSKRYSASHRSSISRVEIEQQFSEEDSDELVASKTTKTKTKAMRRSSRPRARKVIESEDDSEEEEEEEEEEHNDTTHDTSVVAADTNDVHHDDGDVSIDHEEDEEDEEVSDDEEEEDESEDDLVTSKTTKRIVDSEEEDEEEDYDMEGDMSVDEPHEGDGDMSVVVGENEGGDVEVDMALSPSKRSPLATRTSISANNASPNSSNIVNNPSPSQKENVIVKKRDVTPDMDTNAAAAAAADAAMTPTTPSRAPPSSMPVPSPMQANMTVDDGAPDGLPLPRSSEEPDEVKQEEQLSHGIHARSLMQQRATSMQQHVIKTPDEPTQRLTISNLVLTNFKSYAGRQEVGPFHSVSMRDSFGC